MTIIPLPPRPKPPPDTIRVGVDFGQWCVWYYRGDRFLSRLTFDSEAAARAEAARLVAAGKHRQGPDVEPPASRLYDEDEPA